MNRTRTLVHAVATLAVVSVGAASLAVPSPASSAAPKRPDLVVATARVTGGSVAEGGAVTVAHTVRNAGTASAGATHTRFYLSASPAASAAARRASTSNPRTSPTDVLLTGARSVPALAPRKASRSASVRVTVPVGTPPGSYTVLACADDRGLRTERSEVNNCRAAGALKVTAAPGSQTLRLEQFADTTRWPENEEDALWWLELQCSSKVPARRVTPTAALAAVQKLLTQKAGAGAQGLVARSGFADTAVEAQQLAATAVVKGSPGLALASLLRARQLEPRNGTHWTNLAALAVQVGMPNEALGLLDGAAGLDVRRTPLGIAPHAIGLTVRGQALTMTGRYAPARAAYGAARRAEPLLSEADAGLALVEACTGNEDLAMRYARVSRQRTDKRRPPAENPTAPEPEQPEPALDLTQGEITHVRDLLIAETPAFGVELHEFYDGIADGFLAEIDADNAEYEEIQERLRAVDNVSTRAEQQRRDGITTFAYLAGETERAEQLDAEVVDLLDELTLHTEAFWASPDDSHTFARLSQEARDACTGKPDYGYCYDTTLNESCVPELAGEHSQWEQLMSELHVALDAWMVEVSTLMSAYAANLADPDAHRRILLQIEVLEQGQYALIVQQAQHWTHYENLFSDECVEPHELEPPDPAEDVAAGSAGACPGPLSKITAVANLGPTKVKVDCEKVTQEFAAQVLPLLEAYADITYDWKKGETTIFAGSKAVGKLGVVEGSFKSGLYLTVDAKGEVDVGWRVGPSLEGTAGPTELGIYKDEIDISFLGKDTTKPVPTSPLP